MSGNRQIKHFKLFRIFTWLLFACFVTASCTKTGSAGENAESKESAGEITEGEKPDGESPEKIRIAVTIFPEYDWVMNILGEEAKRAEVDWLLDSGVDMHSFQPSAADILKIAECDLFICVGGESDAWVEDVLKQPANTDRRVVKMMDVLGDGLLREETADGIRGQDVGQGTEVCEEEEFDEHVWLSLRNARVLCTAIAKEIGKLDPEHAREYLSRAEAYGRELDALDAAYASAVEQGRVKTLVFADRFPFLYLTEDYGLSYYAAFSGCSAESEASFETIAFLAEKTDELDLPCVIVLEGEDYRIAETVVQSTKKKDVAILIMDSLQSMTRKDMAAGSSYLGTMIKNLDVLKQALDQGNS